MDILLLFFIFLLWQRRKQHIYEGKAYIPEIIFGENLSTGEIHRTYFKRKRGVWYARTEYSRRWTRIVDPVLEKQFNNGDELFVSF